MARKRDWITRMVDLYHKLNLNIIYNATNVREVLKKKCDDSISLPTTIRLLESIVKAQEEGLRFVVNGKRRKIIEKKTPNDDSLYELVELD
ncbi:MAG: hypothetical protein R6U96_13985 [Promethearchaeia archaeon]